MQSSESSLAFATTVIAEQLAYIILPTADSMIFPMVFFSGQRQDNRCAKASSISDVEKEIRKRRGMFEQSFDDQHSDQRGALLTAGQSSLLRTRGLTPRGMEVAQLVLDSFRTPLPAAVRSSRESGRHFAYRHKNLMIDVLLKAEVESGRVLVMGQVMGLGKGVGKNDGLVVLLKDGVKTIVRTATNQFGEFQLEFESIEDPSLQIRLREGCWAAIPLSKMDWAIKPPLD
jgi:hypothetical protein